MISIGCVPTLKIWPISAVYPGARLLPQRVRAFLEALEKLPAEAPRA